MLHISFPLLLLELPLLIKFFLLPLLQILHVKVDIVNKLLLLFMQIHDLNCVDQLLSQFLLEFHEIVVFVQVVHEVPGVHHIIII